MVNNANVNLPVVEGRESEPITRAEFTRFVDQTDRRFQEILEAIRRLSTNPAPGVLPADRLLVGRDPEVVVDRGANIRHRRVDYVEDSEDKDEEDFLDEPIRRGRRNREFQNDRVHGGRRYGGHQRDPEQYRLKVDLPTFNGNLNIEDFLDWLWEVEKFFDAMEIEEDRQVKLVAYKAKGGASAWWEQTQLTRRRQGKAPVRMWNRMKRMLKSRFLPTDHEQLLFQQFQNCKRTNRTVQAYTEEFLRLSVRNNLAESDVQQTARYINGLRLNIQDRVSLHRVFSVEDAREMARKIEMQLERTSPSIRGSNYSGRGSFGKRETD
ncbi:uncharacterized protein LOC115749270 [Rhodamnia argentea]|uniref:Uncharacterized protein LOC115749270 n=1 Tax=Rhodamnia argentea TaxID=178133 RepID=A0A8B8Q5Q6_9MYRT|nr:uncharacterized protein LOC115749270 [Rhodamnia argentea]